MRLKNKANASEIFYVVVPKVVGGGAALILNVLLMRCFNPPDFGKFSLCLYYILLFDSIIGSAVDYATMKLVPQFTRSDGSGVGILERAAFRAKVTLFVPVVLASTVFGTVIGRALFHDDYSAWLIPISSLAGAGLIMLRSLQVHFQIRQRFKIYGLIDLGHNILRYGLIAVALVFFETVPQTVILAFAIAPMLILISSARSYRRSVLCESLGLPDARKELFGAVKWYLLSFCLGAILARSDVYLLSLFRGLNEVGIFSAASIYAMVPELVASYLAVVFQPKIIRNLESGTLASFLKISTRQNLAVAIPTTIATVVTGIFVMSRFVSDSYGAGKMLLLILAPGALASMMTFPLTLPLLLFVYPTFWVKMEGVCLPFLLAAYWLAITHYGAIGAAVVTSTYKIGKCLLSHFVAWKYIRFHEGATVSAPVPTVGG